MLYADALQVLFSYKTFLYQISMQFEFPVYEVYPGNPVIPVFLIIYAFSFYRSKIFGPSKLFWLGTNYKLFRSGTNRFGRVQIILVRFKLDFSGLIFIIYSGRVQIILVRFKLDFSGLIFIWTHRWTRH